MSDKLKAAVKAAGVLGLKIFGLPTLRAKFPKTKLGGLVDEYHDVREARLALNRVASEIETYEKAILGHVIESVSANEGGVVGKRYKGVIIRETIPVVEDWDALYAHVKKTSGFDLLNRALNRVAVKERFDAGKVVPGVGTFQAKKLSVTKV